MMGMLQEAVGKGRGGRFTLLRVLAVLFVVTAPVVAAPFDDVPGGHWTYGALEQLSDVGLIDGYPSGFFSGSRRLTRYEMALSLVDAVERLKDVSGVDGGGGEPVPLDQLVAAYNGAGFGPLSRAEATLLRNALDEFAPELNMLGYTPPPGGSQSAAHRWQLDPSLHGIARDLLQTGPWFAEAPSSDDGAPTPGSLIPAPLGGPSLRALPDGETSSGSFGQPTPIGRLGGTVFYVDEGVPGADGLAASGTTLDGAIHLFSRLLSEDGSSTSDVRKPPPWLVRETRTDMRSFSLADNVSLSGERTQRSRALDDVISTQVNAQVMLGDVSIDGKLRSVQPRNDLDHPFGLDEGTEEELIGVGVTFRLGDVFLTTGQDVVRRSQVDDSEIVKSLTLQYSFMDAAATVSAGWQSLSDTRDRTSVDLNVPIGGVKLGLSYEGDQLERGVALSMTTLAMADHSSLWDNAEALAAFSVREEGKRATSLGLRYALHPEATLLLGYKFIDFAKPDERENVTTAEFSIRF